MIVGELITAAYRTGSFATRADGRDHLDAIADWLVGSVSRTRDSDLIVESNWDVTIARMRAVDPEEQDHEVLRFGHWACGWVEEIATRSGSRCAQIVDEVREAIDAYPILDEVDYSSRLADLEHENWPDILREIRRMIKTHCRQNWSEWGSDEDDLVDDLTDEQLTVASTDRGESDDEGWVRYSSLDIERIADSLQNDLGYL